MGVGRTQRPWMAGGSPAVHGRAVSGAPNDRAASPPARTADPRTRLRPGRDADPHVRCAQQLRRVRGVRDGVPNRLRGRAPHQSRLRSRPWATEHAGRGRAGRHLHVLDGRGPAAHLGHGGRRSHCVQWGSLPSRHDTAVGRISASLLRSGRRASEPGDAALLPRHDRRGVRPLVKPRHPRQRQGPAPPRALRVRSARRRRAPILPGLRRR